MKKLSISISLLITSAGLLFSLTSVRSNKNYKYQDQKSNNLLDTLVDLENRSVDAWKHRDGKFFESFLSDDHVEVGASGVSGKAMVVAFVGSPACVVSSYKVEKLKLTVFGPTTALLTYQASQQTKCNGRDVPSPVWVSSLFVKRDGQWLNVLYQQTPAIN